MLRKLRFTIEKLFYRMGYSGFQRISSPEKLYEQLHNRPQTDIQNKLKEISSRIKKFDDHKYYNKLLKKFVPSWSVPSEKTSFTGKGFGVNTLNLYRKMETSRVFEKVYFNVAEDLKNHQWALSHIVNNPDFSFTAPSIQSLKKGEILTIVYFTFTNLKKLSDDELEQPLIQVSKELYQMYNRSQKGALPPSLKNTYSQSLKEAKWQSRSAKSRLKAKGINTQALDRLLAQSKFIYTHGDLTENNVFQNNIVIDWDYFGLYPLGSDVWKIYIRLKRRKIPVDPIPVWLEKHYQSVITQADWNDFYRNVLYLLYLNGYEKYQKWDFFPELEDQIIRGLKRK